MCTAVDVRKEKKRANNAEHLHFARQCVVEYSEKMDVSAEQHCVIKLCVHLKKIPIETITLLKEAFGKEMLSDSTIRWWHKAIIDGRKSAEFELWGGVLQTIVTVTNINTVTAVIEEDWASHGRYFEKERVTEEDTESEDNESVADDE